MFLKWAALGRQGRRRIAIAAVRRGGGAVVARWWRDGRSACAIRLASRRKRAPHVLHTVAGWRHARFEVD
jgi:hypothetical protein